MRKAEPLAMKYNPTDGYYLAFSGGKDSQCLYHVAQLAGVKFKAHFSPTSVDPPQLIRFIKRNYPDVQFKRIERSIFDEAVKLQILPTMKVRWCCSVFKETSGAGNVTLIGIRHAESSRRAKRNEMEISRHKFSGNFEEFGEWQKEQIAKKYKNLNHDQFSIDKETEVKCIGGKDSILVSPIIDWTDRDVWDFLNGMEIEHCELYDMGYTRIGCILCPMSSRKAKVRDIGLYPHVKEKWIKAIMAIRNGGGLCSTKRPYTTITRAKDGLQAINLHDNSQWGENQPRTLGDAFSNGSADNAAVEQSEETERQIAEKIFDWWFSGKSYREWYSYTFKELKINFNE